MTAGIAKKLKASANAKAFPGSAIGARSLAEYNVNDLEGGRR
jgi:hypothetical protein